MNERDDAFSESIATYALGALPASEATDVAAHLLSCAACRAEYDDLRGIASLVGFAAESTPSELDELTSARMKSRVMTAVRADAGAHANGIASPARVAARSSSPWFAYGLAAAAVVLAVFSSIDDAALRSRVSDQSQTIAALQSQNANVSALERRLALVVAPGSKRFPVANGEVIESNGRILIALSGFPAAPSGKVYQAWTLSRGAKTVAPSVTFTTDAAGHALVELPESAVNLVAVAVSAEPPGGSKAPTSKPTFVRTLS
jgi:anti-sigma factor RsiW